MLRKKYTHLYIVDTLRQMSFPYRSYMNKKKCIFIHIPKVAGTSILSVLGNYAGPRDHIPWYIYYTASPYKFKEYYKFSFVRNPWDRVYSAYRYLCSGGNQREDKALANILNTYPSFDRFIIDGLGQGVFRNHLLFIPQAYFILGPEGNTKVDFIGRYENLQKDFKQVADRIGLANCLPVLNKTALNIETDYRLAYSTTEAVSVIKEIYKQDLTVFGYTFE